MFAKLLISDANILIKMTKQTYFLIILLSFSVSAWGEKNHSLEVTASAYTSTAKETNAKPLLTAWGDTLKPGMKAIAVSRDLVGMGLSHGVEVSIEGLKGKYKVMDKMNKRWKRKIDLYMGNDVKKAKEWGKRKVTIRWQSKP